MPLLRPSQECVACTLQQCVACTLQTGYQTARANWAAAGAADVEPCCHEAHYMHAATAAMAQQRQNPATPAHAPCCVVRTSCHCCPYPSMEHAYMCRKVPGPNPHLRVLLAGVVEVRAGELLDKHLADGAPVAAVRQRVANDGHDHAAVDICHNEW